MKTLILWMMLLTIALVTNAQNVNIPDANFKNALISAGVDTSGDGEISYAEAEAIKNLNVSEKDISNLTGINAFINLDTLNCISNQLTSLDVSNNTALTKLWCSGNQLTSLDISNNTALTELGCLGNQLTSLDVSNNPALKELGCLLNQLTSLDVSGCNALTGLECSYNQLTSLDVSSNTALTRLLCNSNQLTSLDVSINTALEYLNCAGNQLNILDVSNNTALIRLDCGINQLTSLDIFNNTNLKYLDLRIMPALNEVCVWEGFDFDSISIENNSSPNVCFEIDCNGVCETTEIEKYKKEVLYIYPNPSEDIINIEIENKNNATIDIYNVSGRMIYNKALNSKADKIDISGLSEGIYFVKVRQKNNVRIEKLIIY